ncbi:DUF2793 domain-containing protein [Allopontixanthobacter sp.]|uniref:DUF2793 domain-containing protein n=1 Tax=Allopontixanthobacter sp. TaxID=2906452 RepID=UPI002AB9BE07|nr:DUF2793 domain-containing protein [Allopontixanthobacter sp.]MDZ4306607.1 DUF2793 domain-containing protein [Allopontixanthobacter sp.]
MPGTEISPIYGLNIWAGPQSSPWEVENAFQRMVEAFMRGSVADRDLTAPPVSTADGAAYLVAAAATGAWAGHDGELAVAVGVDASNGWLFAAAATEGQILWVEDEAIRIQFIGAAWAEIALGDGTAAGLDFDIDGTLAANSDALVPTQQAVKTYVDTEIAAVSGYTDEQARDAIGAALVAGANISITVDDGADTITIAASGGAGSLDVEDDGVGVVAAASALNFTGAGVIVTDAGGGMADIAIAGGGAVTFATAAEIRTGTEAAKAIAPDQLFAAAAPITLTDAATIAVDMATGINFNVTLAGNRTLGNPTNAKAGQSGRIRVTQDGTGGRTLAYGANWKHVTAVPTLATAAGAIDLFAYFVDATDNIELSYVGTLA